MTATQINVNGQLVNAQPPEDRLFRSAWVMDGDAIVVDVEKAKPIAYKKIEEWRTAQKELPFTVDGIGEFSADEESKTNIDGASQAALMASVTSQPFSIDWSTHDDTVITLDATQMMLVGQGLLAHINAAHVAARVKFSEVEAATTITEIEAVLDGLS
jgi:hypothetical protein